MIIKAKRKDEEFIVLVDSNVKLPSRVGITALGYAYIRVDNKTVLLHRWLTGALKGQVVDHINRNTLDNRIENLRVCTQANNLANRTNKGVSFHKCGYWRARVHKAGKCVSETYHKTEELARETYKKKHVEIHGEFSPFWEAK